MSEIDLDVIQQEILSILEKHGLAPYAFGIHVALRGDDFAKISKDHPDLTHPNMIFRTTTNNHGIQWSIQILKRREINDFPPGMIISPPPDD